jgi:hypothetical protein
MADSRQTVNLSVYFLFVVFWSKLDLFYVRSAVESEHQQRTDGIESTIKLVSGLYYLTKATLALKVLASEVSLFADIRGIQPPQSQSCIWKQRRHRWPVAQRHSSKKPSLCQIQDFFQEAALDFRPEPKFPLICQ